VSFCAPLIINYANLLNIIIYTRDIHLHIYIYNNFMIINLNNTRG